MTASKIVYFGKRIEKNYDSYFTFAVLFCCLSDAAERPRKAEVPALGAVLLCTRAKGTFCFTGDLPENTIILNMTLS